MLDYFAMKRWIIQVFVATVSFPTFAGDNRPLNLGSGEPGLHIIYNTTNQYVIYLDEPWTVDCEHQCGLKDRLDEMPNTSELP
jgi:hypothetical protein